MLTLFEKLEWNVFLVRGNVKNGCFFHGCGNVAKAKYQHCKGMILGSSICF